MYRNSAARDEADLHAVVRAGKELSRPARGSQNSLWRHRSVGLLLCHLRQTTYTHFNPERGSGVDGKKEKASLSVPMTELLEDLTNRTKEDSGSPERQRLRGRSQQQTHMGSALPSSILVNNE